MWTVDAVWVDDVWEGWFRLCGLCANGHFICVGLRGKILRSVVGAVPVCPPVSPHKGASIVKIPTHNACIFGMETPLRGRSGGHIGTAPTCFVWMDCAWTGILVFVYSKARCFIKSKGAHQMIDALLALFLSLLSDSNQRPRDYKSRALAN